MSRNKLATWAVLAAFILSALPTVWAEGSSDEWFYGTPEDDYELEDRDDDGYDDHIVIGYDPDTNVSLSTKASSQRMPPCANSSAMAPASSPGMSSPIC